MLTKYQAYQRLRIISSMPKASWPGGPSGSPLIGWAQALVQPTNSLYGVSNYNKLECRKLFALQRSICFTFTQANICSFSLRPAWSKKHSLVAVSHKGYSQKNILMKTNHLQQNPQPKLVILRNAIKYFLKYLKLQLTHISFFFK